MEQTGAPNDRAVGFRAVRGQADLGRIEAESQQFARFTHGDLAHYLLFQAQ